MKYINFHLQKQPAQEKIAEITLNKFYITFIFTIAVLFCFNLFSFQLLHFFSPNKGYKLIQAKWDILNNLNTPVDILILGDSSSNQGVDSDLIMKKTGLSALNLATIAGTLTLNDYWLLNEYIPKFGVPKCVIAVYTYDIWHRPAIPTIMAKVPINPQKMLNYFSLFELGIRDKISYLTAKYIPSWSENISLQKIFTQPWKINREIFSLTKSGFLSVSEGNQENVLKDTEKHIKFTRKNIFKPSDENIYALKQIGELSKNKDFPVYIVNSPIFEGLYREKSLRYYYNNVNVFIGKILDKYNNMHHIFKTPQTFNSLMMQNSDHLTSEGAKVFTSHLLENINCPQ